MSKKSLEDVLQAAGNPVTLLRNQQTGPNVYPGVPPEYTNWRDETQAWQKTCVLFNQSYHMADLLVEGPDALKLLTRLGVNSFTGFAVDKAPQFVPVNYDGYVIGDVILFYLAPNQFNLVGRIPVLNWIQFHAASGGYDVTVTLDERSAARPDPFNRKAYRFQLQGPNAMKVLEKVIGGKAPELKFFNMGHVTIAGRPVRAQGVTQRKSATIGSRTPCAVRGERSCIAGFMRMADSAHSTATKSAPATPRRRGRGRRG